MAIDSLPKISVVIATYNFAKYLRECIESVLAQTLRPFEIIISDDHSTDDSWTIISEYAQRYPELIKAYRQKKNIGPPHNGISGRKIAKGDLFAGIDGDDRWLPRKLEMEWKALQRHPDARIAYSNVYTIDAYGNRTGIWYDSKGTAPPSGDVFVEVFSRRFFPNCRSIFRNHLMYRSLFDEIGDSDISLESYWDWDKKIRLTARFPVVYSGEALVEYRLHEGGYSRYKPEMQYRTMVQIYEKHLPLLDQRTIKEATQVRCHLESLLALKQSRNSLSERLSSYFSVRNVYERNHALFCQLPKQDRVVLGNELAPIFTQLTSQAAREEIEKGNRRAAIKYWLKSIRYAPKNFAPRLAVQIVLPRWAYQRLRAVYCRFHNIRI